MESGTIFIAGIYGVGKSTICVELGNMLNVPIYSAGDLISKINGEQYGANKAVSDKEANQIILSQQVSLLLDKYTSIILAGHFCIFNKQHTVEYLPDEIFRNLELTKIILLEADVTRIECNLYRRDSKAYSRKELQALKNAEHNQALKVAIGLRVPLILYSMRFDGQDAGRLYTTLKGGIQ